MGVTKRNLLIGLAGIVVLLVSMLVYAQVNAARNYDVDGYQQTTSH